MTEKRERLFKSTNDLSVPSKVVDPVYIQNSPIVFPQLHYYAVNEITLSKNSNLIMGGSYSRYHDQPHHRLRCLLLEELICPYELNGPYFKTRHSALIWPRINADAYTDLVDPKTVYIILKGEFVGKFVFLEKHIELYELVKDQKYQINNKNGSNNDVVVINNNYTNNIEHDDDGSDMQVDYL